MAAVAVTDAARWLALLLATLPALTFAAVLPDERADVLYHRYEGGGLTVDGPSVLVRKNIADKVSISANYYVDNVSSASIDVVTQASPYSETRKEKSIGFDYLNDRTLISAGVITSDESDYEAKTYHFDISQEFFGDLTTLSMGYTRGNDTVRRNGDASFKETIKNQQFRVGLSQIVTRRLLLSLGHEVITDDGYLNSPYRSVRYLATPTSIAFQPEVYPDTRTSNTTTLRALYYLPFYRATVYGEYRHYTDGWDIKAHTYEVGYTHTWKNAWIFDIRYRIYEQSKAEFYSDLFPYRDAQNYLARDRQLSDFDSSAWGLGVSYQWAPRNKNWIDKGSINLSWDRISFNYDDFRDTRVRDITPGSEPLYSFDADILRFFVSVWY